MTRKNDVFFMKGKYVVSVMVTAILGVAILLYQASKVPNPLQELIHITYPSVVLFYHGKHPNPVKDSFYDKYDEMEDEYAKTGAKKIKFFKVNRLHKKLAVQLGVEVYPTLMQFNEKGEEVKRVEYDEDAKPETLAKNLETFEKQILMQ